MASTTVYRGHTASTIITIIIIMTLTLPPKMSVCFFSASSAGAASPSSSPASTGRRDRYAGHSRPFSAVVGNYRHFIARRRFGSHDQSNSARDDDEDDSWTVGLLTYEGPMGFPVEESVRLQT
jgi:hypothetical protein